MTAEDLYRKLGSLTEKGRRLVPIIVDVSGRQAEVKGFRSHPHMGNPTVRLMVELDLSLPTRKMAREEPRVMVKVLPTSAPDRRAANWSTWIDQEGDDMFYFSQALALAERLLQKRNVAEVRVWDPAEGRVIRSFPENAPEPPVTPTNGDRPEPRPRRRRRAEPELSGVKGGSVPPPRSVEVAHVVTEGVKQDPLPVDTGFDTAAAQAVLKRVAAFEAEANAILDQAEDWETVLRARHPEKFGAFWVDVRWDDGTMDDSKPYAYKSLSGVINAVRTLLSDPVDPTLRFRDSVWVHSGFGRSQRTIACLRRSEAGIVFDRQTEYNLGVRR